MTGSSLRARIVERASLASIAVSPDSLSKLDSYYALLQRWNEAVNLTALPLPGFPAETVDRLIVESLIAASVVEDVSGRWFDVGSGAGSPAVPLKILRPDLDLTFVESNQRKVAFLNELIRALPLPSASVIRTRFEELAPEEVGRIDMITLRAVRCDTSLLHSIRRTLRAGGVFLYFHAVPAEAQQFDAEGFARGLERPLYPSCGFITRFVVR